MLPLETAEQRLNGQKEGDADGAHGNIAERDMQVLTDLRPKEDAEEGSEATDEHQPNGLATKQHSALVPSPIGRKFSAGMPGLQAAEGGGRPGHESEEPQYGEDLAVVRGPKVMAGHGLQAEPEEPGDQCGDGRQEIVLQELAPLRTLAPCPFPGRNLDRWRLAHVSRFTPGDYCTGEDRFADPPVPRKPSQDRRDLLDLVVRESTPPPVRLLLGHPDRQQPLTGTV